MLANRIGRTFLRNGLTAVQSKRCMRHYTRKRFTVPDIMPDKPTFVLFPGQGSQYVGMAKAYVDIPEAKELFDMASDILRYDLLKLCNSGPIEQLNQTIYCQPAVMVTSLAALELLKKHQPNAIESCIGTAGFSLGELTALVFAGAIPFDAGVRLAQTRGKLMQAASDRHKGGMATIMTQSSSQLSLACKRGREWCVDYGAEEPDIVIANFLFSTCKVISGCTEGLRYIESNMDTYGLRRMLPVPAYGAFHSELMRSAVDPFAAALQKTWIEQPAIDVYSNVTGAKYDSPTQILKLLPKQMVRPVRWEQTMCILYDFKQHTSDYPATFVCGPGNALLNILKVINGQAWKHSTKIGA